MPEDIVLIPEAEKQYPDEWLLFEIVELDEHGSPLRGRLLAHSPDRSVIDEVLLKTRPTRFYIVWTGEIRGTFVLCAK
ncbi:MAG: hypothetical protein SLRJCFUN_000274 [Candidatus Fervidibacter sp.]